MLLTATVLRPAGAGLLLTALVLLCVVHGAAAESGADRTGPLDGMVFKGHIGPADDPDLPDYLYFQEGRFWSGECVRCGFEPGVYWVSYLDDGIAFRGVLQSADRGTFTYEGRIRGAQIDVAISWRHERWYWTIDRELRFVGERAQAGSSTMSLEEAREAAGRGAFRADRCPS